MLQLLARREFTVSQARDRLHQRGFEPGAIRDAILKLSKEGALDDGRAALAAARRALGRRQGPLRAVRELEAIGIDRQQARDTVREVFGDTDEQALIDKALRRRLRGPVADPVVFRRLHAYLLRQGFSASGALQALRSRTQLPEDVET